MPFQLLTQDEAWDIRNIGLGKRDLPREAADDPIFKLLIESTHAETRWEGLVPRTKWITATLQTASLGINASKGRSSADRLRGRDRAIKSASKTHVFLMVGPLLCTRQDIVSIIRRDISCSTDVTDPHSIYCGHPAIVAAACSWGFASLSYLAGPATPPSRLLVQRREPATVTPSSREYP
jgi:hypothetical protein